jgi:PAS domain S-box-containing protein
MSQKPTYEELEQRIIYLEEDTIKRKRAEELVKESAEKYRQLSEGTFEAVVWHDEGKIIEANEQYYNIFGYKPEELAGKDAILLTSTPDSAKFMKEQMSSGRLGPYEVVGLKNDGTQFPMEIRAKKMQYKGKIARMAAIRDLTARKQAEEALQKAYAELEMRVKERTAELAKTNEQLKQEIAERKRTEKALKESEELIASFFIDAPAGFAILDHQLRYIKINESLAKMNRLPMEEHIGKSISEVIGDHLAQKIVPILERVLKTGGPIINSELSGSIPGEKGPARHWVFNAFPITWAGQKGIAHIIVEITQQKRAEEALRESESMIRALINATTDSVFLIDAEGTVILMNNGGIKRLGLSLDDIIGRCIYDFLPEDVAERRKAKAEQVVASGKPIRFADQRTGMHLDNTIYPVFNTQGRVEKVAVFARDITERKQIEEALRHEREQLFSIFNSINQVVYVTDPKTYEILYVNDAVKNAFEKHLVGSLCYREFQGMESPCDFCTNEIILKEKYKPYQWEYHNPILKRDYLLTDRIIKWPDGRDVRFEIAIDITKRKQAEEALILSNKELQKESNQRKILSKRLIDLLEKDRHEIAMELHDHIGQVLTSLKMNLEMVGSQLRPANTELASQIKAAEQKAIKALKDIKSISYGLKPRILETLGLESSLRELFNEIQKGADIQLHFFSGNIPHLFGREKELAVYRIAQEALANVLKHARATSVYVNLVKKEEVLSLSVEDDGVGFIQDEAVKISEWKGPLGLVIMRERAMQLGGELHIESQPGKGTLVLAEIPI